MLDTQVAWLSRPVQSKLLIATDGYSGGLSNSADPGGGASLSRTTSSPANRTGSPAEVEACAQLESDGWIAELQAPIEQSAVRRSHSLAVEQGFRGAFLHWAERLKALAQQVADGIDES